MRILGFGKKNYEAPDPAYFGVIREETKHTPDLWNLTRRMQHNIFIWDEFMLGLPKHEDIVNDATRRAVAFTAKEYCMWKKRLGLASFPIMLPPKGKEAEAWKPARVKGTIYSVSTKTIIQLDKYKQNGVHFKRDRIEVIVPNRRTVVHKGKVRGNSWEDCPTQFDRIKVWAYVGLPLFWEDQLDGGYNFAPVKLFKPRDGRAPFYLFTREEFKDV